MKKIMRLLKILLVIAAAAGIFYRGWIQIKLDEDTYAVAFTKSSGYLDKVFKPGKFSWSPYRIIPGNFKLMKYRILPRTVTADETGILASGEVYGKYMPGQPDFSYRISFTARYILKPESLPELAENNSLTPDTLNDFYDATDSRITAIVTEIVKDRSSDPQNSPFLHPKETSDYVKSAVENAISYISFMDITFSNFHFPDIALYEKARKNYFEYIENKNSVEKQIKKTAAENEIKEASRIELLKRYGEILKEYPELVQVLAANPSMRSEVLPSISLTGEDKGE